VYLTADIVANAVANGGPGRAVVGYAGTTAQSFTTLAQNVVASTSLADTGTTKSFAPLAGALAALVAGVSLVIARRKQQNS
jgi:LPXTG-motif cell wall-anchored protein